MMREVFQLEKLNMKTNPTLNKEPRMHLWRAFDGENNEMIDDIKSFKIETDETAMLRKAYFQEKKDIQSIRQAFQLEKQNTEKEIKVFNK